MNKFFRVVTLLFSLSIFLISSWLFLFQLVDFVRLQSISKFPIITGTVVASEHAQVYLFPFTDLTIEIPKTSERVHALVAKYAAKKALNTQSVRFHYSSDPTTEVFLIDQEYDPLPLMLFLGLIWPLFFLEFACQLLYSRSFSSIAPSFFKKLGGAGL